MAIQTISHRGLRELFENGRTHRITPQAHERLLLLMDRIDAATDLKDFQGVSHFHALTGDRRGSHAFHVTRNWRLTFRFDDGDALDLNYEDYHR